MFSSPARPRGRPAARRCRPALELLEDRLQPAASLGTAANYAVLGLTNARINNNYVTVNGDVGVSHGGALANQARSGVSGNVHTADDWEELLLPEIER